MIDVDADRNALGQAHPGEDRVDRGEALLGRLSVGDVDGAGDAADMAVNDLAVPISLMVAGSPSWIAPRLVSSK